jgi:hypothetical protein
MCNFVQKNQLDAPHNLVYFVNLYTFRAYLGPSSGGTTVCIQQLVLIILQYYCTGHKAHHCELRGLCTS